VHVPPSFTHWPAASQSWGCWPLQRFVAGVHAPMQVAVVGSQACATHVAPLLTQSPFALQTCGSCPLQRNAPGVHVPAHSPALQAWSTHAVPSCQVPSGVQDCGV
jgi:hypothetical protein